MTKSSVTGRDRGQTLLLITPSLPTAQRGSFQHQTSWRVSHLVQNVTVEAESLQQDADLDGAPAGEEQGHHHHHHPGDPCPHCCCSLRLSLQLESGTHSVILCGFIKGKIVKARSISIFLLLGSCCRWGWCWAAPCAWAWRRSRRWWWAGAAGRRPGSCRQWRLSGGGLRGRPRCSTSEGQTSTLPPDAGTRPRGSTPAKSLERTGGHDCVSLIQ